VEVGTLVDSETGDDLPVFFERHTEQFYFYEPEPEQDGNEVGSAVVRVDLPNARKATSPLGHGRSF
jgi:hypothetical protein